MPRTANKNLKIEKLEAQLRNTKHQLKQAQQELKSIEIHWKQRCKDEFARGVEIIEKWISNRDKAMAKAVAVVDKEILRQAKSEAARKTSERSAGKMPVKKLGSKQRGRPAKKAHPVTKVKRGRPAKQETLLPEVEPSSLPQLDVIEI